MNKILAAVFLPLCLLGLELDKIEVLEQKSQTKDFEDKSFLKPFNQHLINQKTYEQKSSTNVVDALKEISNVNTKDLGANTKSLSIRGFSGARVSTFVDGAKVQNHGLDMGGGGDLSSIQTPKSLVLIKGSPSVIYDPGASGGVVLVETLPKADSNSSFVFAKFFGGLDNGYDMSRFGTSLGASYGGLYLDFGHIYMHKKTRAVKDKKAQQAIIDQTNQDEERLDTKYELKDFASTSSNTNLNASFNRSDYAASYKFDRSLQKDLTIAIGVDDPRAFHYDEMNKDSHNFRFDFTPNLNVFQNARLNINYSKQQRRQIEFLTTLSTLQTRLDTQSIVGDMTLDFGLQYTKDDAQTRVFSLQDYLSSHLQTQYFWDDFIFGLGIRANYHQVTQQLRPGENKDLALELVGVTGLLKEPITDFAPNFAAFVLYNFTESLNAGVNISTTYRYPTLYERFAFSKILFGGGAELEAERGLNYDFSLKYKTSNTYTALSIFYTDFSIYNSLRQHRSIKDILAFNTCNEDPKCSPYSDENEPELFDIMFVYSSFKEVKRKGFELEARQKFNNLTINASLAQTDISPAIIDFGSSKLRQNFANSPLEFKLGAHQKFDVFLAPWISLSYRYVSNNVALDQETEFKPFGVTDLYGGFSYKALAINTGLRNVFDETYKEPYSPFDGIKRSAFVSFILDLKF